MLSSRVPSIRLAILDEHLRGLGIPPTFSASNQSDCTLPVLEFLAESLDSKYLVSPLEILT